jgi:hypothetical protein
MSSFRFLSFAGRGQVRVQITLILLTLTLSHQVGIVQLILFMLSTNILVLPLLNG